MGTNREMMIDQVTRCRIQKVCIPIGGGPTYLVVSPLPRGRGTPLRASSTELFPLLWSPITAI
jgi:hypothetical protein